MKKIILTIILLAVLLVPMSAQAMETKNYGTFKTKNWSTPVAVNFSTYRQGDIAVTASFQPRDNGGYILQVWDANGAQLCFSYSNTHNGFPAPLTCFASGAAAGNYRAEFQAYNGGSVYVTMEIAAETNP